MTQHNPFNLDSQTTQQHYKHAMIKSYHVVNQSKNTASMTITDILCG